MSLIYLLGLHGGCKCRIPAPTKAYTTARQSGSTMQVSTYLSNTHSLFILKLLILEARSNAKILVIFPSSQLRLPRYAPAGVSQARPPVGGEHIMSH